MACECMYIFDNTEYRRNMKKYKELEDIICRVKGYLEPLSLYKAKKMNVFQKFNAEDEEYLPIYKKDLLLWVYGRPHLHTQEALYEAAETDSERDLIRHLLIGIPDHMNEDFWYENTGERVKKRLYSNAAELMRKPDYMTGDGLAQNGKKFYIVGDLKGNIDIGEKEGVEFLSSTDPDYIHSHFVIHEITASDPETAVQAANKWLHTTHICIGDMEFELAEYYCILFKYFVRLNKSNPDLPGNFWEWLADGNEEQYFFMAYLYHTTNIVAYEDPAA